MSDIVYDPGKHAWCHLPSGSCSSADLSSAKPPSLPTYATVADVLEKKNGSGIRLLGWTAARTVLIAPFIYGAVASKWPEGPAWKKALFWGLTASLVISGFTLLRIANAEYELNRSYLGQRRWLRARRSAARR